MISPTSFTWFAKHELTLSWRDLYAMLSGNRPRRGKKVFFAISIAIFLLHLLAYAALKPLLAEQIIVDKQMLIMVSGFLLLPISLMASQAMESITRAFYSRSDLELILSSPAPVRKIFTIRITAIAFATTALTLSICACAINILALFDSPKWLYAYFVVIGFGLLSTSVGIFLTMAMFKILGPRKTRLFSQILSACVGASFVIGVQMLAILSIGSISRVELLKSQYLASISPTLDHWVWVPALAATGNLAQLFTFVAVALGIFVTMLALYAGKFGETVLKASSADFSQETVSTKKVTFKSKSASAVLRQKEWKLLLRDKWIFSQTLMQLLYLIPPAFLLWKGVGDGNSSSFVVSAVIVMASGQLAGGLAWLAISGEDAYELVHTSPVTNALLTRAKVEAVIIAVGVILMPILALFAFVSFYAALITALMAMVAIISATLVQLWFKTQASRSLFRRRQTSSRVATLAEALSSIFWAGTASLVVMNSSFAIFTATLTIIVLLFVWWISPARQENAKMKMAV